MGQRDHGSTYYRAGCRWTRAGGGATGVGIIMTRQLDHLAPTFQAITTFAGHLVQIDTQTIIRMCSFGNITWADEFWTAGMIVAIQFQEDAPYAHGGSIEIADPDCSVLAAMLRSGIVGSRVRAWYAPAPDLTIEPILVLDAFADVTSTNPERGTLLIGLTPDNGEHLFSPRERVSTADYPTPIAPGSEIKFGGGKITLMGNRL
jgi:hypothetical protein